MTEAYEFHMPPDVRHWVYVLYADDECIYVGYTTDLLRRIGEHKKGFGKKEPAKDFDKFKAIPMPSKREALYKEAEWIRLLEPTLNKITGRPRKPDRWCKACGELIKKYHCDDYCSNKCSVKSLCHSNKKLTAAEEMQMCEEYLNGSSMRTLAESYKMDRRSIGRILNRYGISKRHKRW